jgi:surface protein
MFTECFAFNQPIGNWNVSNVTTMDNMFSTALNFNQNLGRWFTGETKASPTSIIGMFSITDNFNNGGDTESINYFDISKVVSLKDVFSNAKAFNGKIGNWNTSGVTDMSGFLRGATSFTDNISNFNVSKVRNFSYLLADINFNQDISDWDTSSAIFMSGLFYNNKSFNRNINNWDVGNVRFFNDMFNGSNFNLPLSNWDIGLGISTPNISVSNMFANCPFNQDISMWDMRNVNNTSGMFSPKTRFLTCERNLSLRVVSTTLERSILHDSK